MIRHWLTMGWRSLIANPLFSLITIASLSVGCCGALLAAANIRQHLSFERWVPHADRIVLERQTFGMGSERLGDEARLFKIPGDRVNMGLAGAIEGRIDDLVAQTRVTNCNFVKWPDTIPPSPGVLPVPPMYQGRCVDPDFFKVFELEFVEGSGANALAAPDSIVISEKIARKYFGAGPAIGKTFDTNRQGMILRVTGVIRDAPAATDLKLDALMSMAFSQRQSSAGGSDPNSLNILTTGQHYIRMAEGVDADRFMAVARTVMQGVFDARAWRGGSPPPGYEGHTEEVSLVPLPDIHLAGQDRTGMVSSGDVSMLLTLGTAAAALLGVSAFNYVTLSLARSLRRRREVGLRKVLGAGQGDLVRHYLAESALVTAISLAIGYALAQLLNPWFARTIGQPETLFEMFDPAFISGALALFALLALAVGAYPAFYLANVRPRAGIEESGTSAPTGMGRLVSGGLLGLQIAAATVLLGVALTMAAQADYVARRPLGFDYKGVYISMMQPCPAAEIRTAGRQTTRSDRDASNLAREQCKRRFVELLHQTPGIGRVTSSSIFSLINDSILTQGFGRAIKGEELGKAAHYTVGVDYLQAMGATLLAGRFFDANSPYDRAIDAAPRTEMGWPGIERTPAIVTRAVLSRIGADTPEQALGQVIYMQMEAPYGMEIVGVVEDWHQRSLKYNVHPIIFSPSEENGMPTFEVTADDPDALVQSLRTQWNELIGAPPQAFLMAAPVERAFSTFYEADRKLMQAVITFSSVAIVVAAVGVFGLSSFEMRRRVREIGVRKALGASPWRVAMLAIGRAILFAAIASVLAWPFAWWIAEAWLTSYVYRTTLGPTLLPAASLVVVATVAIAVVFNAARAAAIRPGAALRES